MADQSTAQLKNSPQCFRHELAHLVREIQAVGKVLELLINRKHHCESCPHSGGGGFEESVTGDPAGILIAGEDKNNRPKPGCGCCKSSVKLIPELTSEKLKVGDAGTLEGKQQLRSYAEVVRAPVMAVKEEMGSDFADGTSSRASPLEAEISGRAGQPWRVRLQRNM